MYDTRKMGIWQADFEKTRQKYLKNREISAKKWEAKVEIKVRMDTIYGM